MGSRWVVPNYGGTLEKSNRERYALAEFCNRMRIAHGADYQPVNVARAIKRGLIASVDGATVDGVLHTSRGYVAIEMLGYSPLGDRGDIAASDQRLRTQVGKSLGRLLEKKSCWLYLDYRVVPRENRQEVVKNVPVGGSIDKVVEELRLMIARAERSPSAQFTSFRFPRTLSPVSEPILSEEAQNADAFPECSKFFRRVRLQWHDGSNRPQIGSALGLGASILDSGWLQINVKAKCAKSLKDANKQRANGSPVWFIVHSDGQAFNQSIGEGDRKPAAETLRSVLKEEKHGFRRAYWADRTGFKDAAWVKRVL